MTDLSSTRGARRAIIITVSMIVVLVVAVVISMLVTSATSEPVEEECGLVNDLNPSQNCKPRAE